MFFIFFMVLSCVERNRIMILMLSGFNISPVSLTTWRRDDQLAEYPISHLSRNFGNRELETRSWNYEFVVQIFPV
jgi:hypothetical protein